MAETARLFDDRPTPQPLAPGRYRRPALYSDYLEATPFIPADRYPNLRWAGQQLARLVVVAPAVLAIAGFLWSRG
jgi:hypothetical protein